MSAWIMHLRIAESLLQGGVCAEALPFYVGCIAPDSGKLTGKFDYSPPKSVTHWHNKLPDRLESNKLFYTTYGRDEKDDFRRSFYLGYFAHVLTDTFFVNDLVLPIINANEDQWKSDPWSVKGDWFNDDFLFLEKNPDYIPYLMLSRIGRFDNCYLDYFTRDDLTNRVRDTVAFYREHSAEHEREQKYLSIEQAEAFIPSAVKRISDIFRDMGA